MKTGPNRTRTKIHFTACLTLKLYYTLALPRRTKHMAKDGQVCFHRRLFADPVKPQPEVHYRACEAPGWHQ